MAAPAWGRDIGQAQGLVLAIIRLDRHEGSAGIACHADPGTECVVADGDSFDKYRVTLSRIYAGNLAEKTFTARIRMVFPPRGKFLYVLIDPQEEDPELYALPKGEKHVLVEIWSEVADGFCLLPPTVSGADFADSEVANAITNLRRDHPCKNYRVPPR